jgi:hypothetical protein
VTVIDASRYERALLDLSERLVDLYSGRLPADRVIAAFAVAHRQTLNTHARLDQVPTVDEYIASVTELVRRRLEPQADRSRSSSRSPLRPAPVPHPRAALP